MPTSGDYWLNIQALGATATLVVDGNTITTAAAKWLLGRTDPGGRLSMTGRPAWTGSCP